ncbi:MAG TPA: TonB family protein [Blastocatellia bacterium]|jgi:protein TonB|nr:TonB family protein [Blastocatellia bacterium]
MLEDSLFESQGHKPTRKPATVLVSVVIHFAVVTVLALIPLIQIQAIPMPKVDMSMWAPKAEAPKGIEVTTLTPRIRTIPQVDPGDLVAPPSIPTDIALVVDAPVGPAVNLPLPSAGGSADLRLRELIGSQPEAELPAPPQPPPPPPPPAVKVAPTRVSSGVQQANLIHQVRPVYPHLAVQTRIQGVVLLEAVISKEGRIESLRVISGHPLLNLAALDAVQQWQYRPTLLNGEPVAVITTITVNFSLSSP